MKAIVKNIESMWSVCVPAAERCVTAVKRELGEFEKGWAEVEAYWNEHPETRLEQFFYNHC